MKWELLREKLFFQILQNNGLSFVTLKASHGGKCELWSKLFELDYDKFSLDGGLETW